MVTCCSVKVRVYSQQINYFNFHPCFFHQLSMHSLYWMLAGFLKAGEHPIEGVHRELMEETGMKVKIIDLLGIYTDFYAATGDHTQNTFYIGELSNGKPKIMDDISDLKWIRIDELGKHGDEVGFQCIKDALRD